MQGVFRFEPEDVILPLSASTKNGVLSEFADKVAARCSLPSGSAILQLLLERESLGSTGIGDGIAIPHCKSPALNAPVILFGRSDAGIDFKSVDDKPARLFFLLVTPEDAAGTHLKLLSRISHLLKGADVRNRLLEATSAEEVVEIVMRQGGTR
ncbi:PTS sugar transporter subunit IIA [Geobacter pelophilus]|uniref:PTS sugar transporter subunit IIA n=1 Tax=Geoanaerobacter pelophilus TaxID=60036 RepID=A0AAW4L160_9BACT|nr:PTS sugar transporter subunit IIA [Geoanaerobacter pelophilus]MBT0663267.1 PTS sugar transporter subunit IIA [Geoanaerobacter pelophilus]